MTIAVGQLCKYGDIKCVLVAADSRVVASDLATSFGSKVQLNISLDDETKVRSCAVIANACEDAHAATMLAHDMASAVRNETVSDVREAADAIKTVMTEWHSAYGAVKPPGTQFIVGLSIGGHCAMFLCSPPNTVLQRLNPIAIGQGSRVVDPLLPPHKSSDDLPSAEAAILRATYWIYRAKRDEGAYCGGFPSIMIVSARGGFSLVGKTDAESVEELCEQLDNLIQQCRYGVLDRLSPEDRLAALNKLEARYKELADKAGAFTFSHLGLLKGMAVNVRPVEDSEAAGQS